MAIPRENRSGQGQGERRRSVRAPFDRGVIYAPDDLAAPLRDGVSIDIGADGIRIRTTQPERLGAHLQIELARGLTASGTPPYFIEGVVKNLRRIDQAAFELGIKFRPGRTPQRNLDFASLQGHAAPHAADEGPPQTGRVPRGPAPKDGGPRLGRALVALLALLVLALVLLPRATPRTNMAGAASDKSNGTPKPGRPPAPQEPQATAGPEALGSTAPLAEERASLAPVVHFVGASKTDRPRAAATPIAEPAQSQGTAMATGGPPQTRAAAPRMGNAQAGLAADEGARLIPGRRGPGATGPRAAQRSETPQAVGTLAGQLILAQEAGAASGPRAAWEAVAGLERLLQEEIDPLWRESVTRYREALEQEDVAAQREASFSEEIGLVPVADSDDRGGPLAAVAVAVDKSAHILSLLEADRTVARFPVGLGADDNTPAGLYRVVTKIKHPDWYNRGEPVRYGDPRNPLGSRWIGLGGQGGPTPYGIHGTNEPESIGKDASRGCIRMRPADVERLFDCVERGSLVRIHS